jgi:hypothetical protein
MNNLLPANVEGRNAKSQEDFERLAPKQFAGEILAKVKRRPFLRRDKTFKGGL